MCIVLISNKHPRYPFILASNRDEFLGRPTKPADFWKPPNENVLGGRDLFRPAQGTWLGVTRDGRLAVLTNFREETDSKADPAAVSRGEMVNAYLTARSEDVEDTENFVKRLISGEAARGSGGFSLVCGRFGKPLAVVSNRMQNEGEVKWVGKNGDRETVGLSNAAFGDHSWPKVVDGETGLESIIEHAAKLGRETISEALFGLLSKENLPATQAGESWETVVKGLRNSIFIPKIGAEHQNAEDLASAKDEATVKLNKATSGAYGTQKQTVVMVDNEGHLFFTERTLYDADGKELMGRAQSERRFDFQITESSS